ncbi:hypothetical protein AnigIFM56816_011467 [Aspergillus niger]|nr:hypothetical protein AnigIFM56816_011467 [Aspergillus niger]
MSQITFFPDRLWHGVTLAFPQNDLHSLPSSSWTVKQKISETSSMYTQEEAEEWRQFPLAAASFECENAEDSNNKTILRVFMEIPCADTNCAAEGGYKTPNSVNIAVGAHKLLTLNNAQYSPKLVQYMEQTQTPESRRFFLPGGRIYYVIINKLPGTPLGNGLVSYTGDGRSFEEGLFWNLSRDERDRVRAAFQIAYREHTRSRVTVAPSSLSEIFWDKESGNVYIQGHFEPLDQRDIAPTLYYELNEYGPKVLRMWGLAIAPKFDVDYNVPMAELEKKGWVL